MRGFKRIGSVLGLLVLAGSAMALPAGASARVGPNQYFTGVINGHNGNTAVPIVIRMACFGPIRPGQTGHPMAGQTLAVHQLFPPTASAGSLGFTGKDSRIDVFFNVVPPVPTTGSATTTPFFERYDVTKPLPTSLELPCAGTGTAYFVPIPVIPPSRAATVPVAFVGQP